MNLDAVTRALDDHGVRYALIGAMALAARGAARSTLDVDLLVADKKALEEDMWRGLDKHGIRVEIRRGDLDDPLLGVVRIHGEEPIDVFRLLDLALSEDVESKVTSELTGLPIEMRELWQKVLRERPGSA